MYLNLYELMFYFYFNMFLTNVSEIKIHAMLKENFKIKHTFMIVLFPILEANCYFKKILLLPKYLSNISLKSPYDFIKIYLSH